ncbi:MAG: GPP34 family phosphoprotein [Rhodospirillaceae bacterium]|nr:GPP34 family phosphoprotein [Rhodospirillaceae bacterium]MCY4066262.1 GPP34 family phosphoprotein [Rhodospirillaceae bacterium]
MLTFTEELLLLLDDEAGAYLPARQHAMDCALAGAALLDLAFAGRIDTDLETLVVTDPAPTGTVMLDRILSKIWVRAGTTDTQTWIRKLAIGEAGAIREQALSGLVARGILERREARLPWAFGPDRYATLDDGPGREIRGRIEAALDDGIPLPRDVALVALADACQLLPDLFPDRAIEHARIAQLRRMDLIGREVAGTVADIQRRIVLAARTQAQRYRKLLLSLSLVGAAVAAATLLSPRVPVPDRFPPTVLERLWFDALWQQWSGYLLLVLSVVSLVIAVIVRKRLVPRIASSNWWRLSHVVLGVACVLALFAHTGFRFGDNLNAALMGFYLAVLLSGTLAGVAIGGAQRLRRIGAGRIGIPLRTLLRVHVLALCPLPALLAVHVLLVYLY